ncbi:MAG: hypothetical protein ACXAEU_05860 [Candidatus Hodarchaeales archaeon]|jgi:hypothetical protein
MMVRMSPVKPVKTSPMFARSKFFKLVSLSIIILSLLFAFNPPALIQDYSQDEPEIPIFPTSFPYDLVPQEPLKGLPTNNTFTIYKNRAFFFNNSDSNDSPIVHWIFEITNTRSDEITPIDVYLDGNWFTRVEINASTTEHLDIPVSKGFHAVQFNIWTWQIRQYFHEYLKHDFTDGLDHVDVLIVEPENGFAGERIVDYIFVEPKDVNPFYLKFRQSYVEAALEDFENVRQVYLDMSSENFTFKLGAVIGWIKTNFTDDWMDKNHDNATTVIINMLDPYYSFKDTDTVAVFYLTDEGPTATGGWNAFITDDGGKNHPHVFYGRITVPARASDVTGIVTHEFGHTFTLAHPDVLGSFTGISFSLMGYTGRLTLGFYRYALSWLDVEYIYGNQTILEREMIPLSGYNSDDRLMVLVHQNNSQINNSNPLTYHVLEYRTADENPLKNPRDLLVLYKVNSTVFELAGNRDRYDIFLKGIEVVKEWVRPSIHNYGEYLWYNENNKSDMSIRVWWTRYDRPVIWLNDRLNVTLKATGR